MRSSRDLRAAFGLALMFGLAACGMDSGPQVEEPDPPDADVCKTSYLDYQNFGEPFSLDWCRGCHSAALPAGMRQKAPVGVDFDGPADLVKWKDRILARSTGPTPSMPPAGGPSDTERALLAEWLTCGAK